MPRSSLLHTALIVHDDVIDRDFVRRGGPNVSGSYRDEATTAGLSIPIAEHRGTSVAVIAGDLALTGAHRLVEGVGADDGVRARLLTLLDEAVFASAAGELADVDFSLMPGMPSVDEVLEMERLKTAVYSFEAPLQAGAILAGADDEVVAALGSSAAASASPTRSSTTCSGSSARRGRPARPRSATSARASARS